MRDVTPSVVLVGVELRAKQLADAEKKETAHSGVGSTVKSSSQSVKIERPAEEGPQVRRTFAVSIYCEVTLLDFGIRNDLGPSCPC